MSKQQLPTTTQGWQVSQPGQNPGLDSLRWSDSLPLPSLGPTEVLVKFHAASLNFRDIAIATGQYPLPVTEGIIPGSDGAGEILAVGPRVTRFTPGDKVITYVWQSGWFGGAQPSAEAFSNALGATVDGTFRSHGVFEQQGLVRMPESLDYKQGASVKMTFLTAWNALTGGAKAVGPGDHVLVQGSGGVSIAALQIAVALGAKVVAITSSAEKGDVLKKLGAAHVINYKEDENWGTTAKKLTGGLGFTHILDVVGSAKSFEQSVEAVAAGGELEVVGFLKAEAGGPNFLQALMRQFTVRGVNTGSRVQLEEVLRVIESKGIEPYVDGKVFKLEELKEGLGYMLQQKHVGKVVVQM